MLKQVEGTIHQHDLIKEGDHVLAAVSGGADSVAMLYLLFSLSRTLGFTLSVIHINHGLREKASDKDARFVQILAGSLGLSCRVKKVSTKKMAKQPGVSLEMAARRLRHQVYLKVCQKDGAVSVAVAHSLEDQAETVLMRLSRGSGPRGLGGIRYSNSVGALRLIRPCLNVHRDDLRTFLKTHGIRWREDASNQSRKFTRNRIRHDVLPVLQKINPSAVAHITQAAALCRDDHEALEMMLVPHLPLCLNKDTQGQPQLIATQYRVLPKALQRRVLMHWLDAIGMDPSDMETSILLRLAFMLSCAESSHLTLPGGIQVICSQGILRCEPQSCPAFCYDLQVTTDLDLPEAALCISSAWVDSMKIKPSARPFLKYPQKAFLSLSKNEIKQLTIRSWREGDLLAPLGFDGRKKLQDIFTDSKVPRTLRHGIPLLCHDDEVLWIPGYQIARRCKVTSASKYILHLSVSSTL